MRTRAVGVLAVTVIVGGCAGYESEYERHVADHEPVYCYRSLGDATCSRAPRYRDRRQLVNYFGAHPRRYDPPEAPEPMNLDAPPRVKQFYRDPEPEPGPPEAAVAAREEPPPRSAGAAARKSQDATEDTTLSTIITYLPLVVGAAQIIAAFVF